MDRDSSTIKILVIEDDEFLRDFYSELLTSEGYTVETAMDGVIGLQKLRAGGWSLVMLDIMLPKKDGLTILQEIKAQPPKISNGPIVVLTNLGSDTVINEAFLLGVEGFLVKSAMSPEQVLSEVKGFLSGQKKRN